MSGSLVTSFGLSRIGRLFPLVACLAGCGGSPAESVVTPDGGTSIVPPVDRLRLEGGGSSYSRAVRWHEDGMEFHQAGGPLTFRARCQEAFTLTASGVGGRGGLDLTYQAYSDEGGLDLQPADRIPARPHGTVLKAVGRRVFDPETGEFSWVPDAIGTSEVFFRAVASTADASIFSDLVPSQIEVSGDCGP